MGHLLAAWQAPIAARNVGDPSVFGTVFAVAAEELLREIDEVERADP